MKKLIAILSLVVASTGVSAHGYHHHHGHGWGMGGAIMPLVIGGVIGWGISQSQKPVYDNTPKVYNINTAPPYPGATPIYQQRSQWEPSCNCYVVVYAQIGWQ